MSGYGPRIIDWLSQLRSSYGFLPGCMAVGALLVAIGVLALPAEWGPVVADAIGLPSAPDAEAMRALMSLIAASTIGTGAVAFSVIVAASVTAAGQYGPRLLTNFLADRATQVTLGVFVSSFVYAIFIYAVIREGERNFGLAGMVGMVFAFASVAALIFFLHHAPAQLRINQAISNIGESLLKNVSTRFPANCGYPVRDVDVDTARKAYEDRKSGFPLKAQTAGLVSIIDGNALARSAAKAGVLVTLRIRPGQFQTPGQAIADIHGGGLDDACLDELRSAFAVAKLRTPSQDNEFLADELTEIAMRALSPGINDPYTAIACMEWLGAALSRMAEAEDPLPYRRAEGGGFRVYAEPYGFADYLQGTFGRIRQVSATNVRAAEGHFHALALAAVGTEESDVAMTALRAEARALLEQAEIALSGPDLMAVRHAAETFDAALALTPPALDKFR
ncbi:MAG: DUF2254 domain-containing protein [Pacificimonas sp.]